MLKKLGTLLVLLSVSVFLCGCPKKTEKSPPKSPATDKTVPPEKQPPEKQPPEKEPPEKAPE